MAGEDELFAEVHRRDLGVAAAGAEGVDDFHHLAVLEIAFAAAGHAACGKQRTAQRESGRDPFIFIAVEPAIVVGEAVQIELGDEAIETDGDAIGPVERFRGRPGRQRIRGRVFSEVKDGERLLLFGFDGGGGGAIDHLGQVAHLQNLDMGAELTVVLGEVAVHVEHTGVGVAEDTHAAAAQGTQGTGGGGPVADLGPGAAGGLFAALLLCQHAGDDVKIDIAAVENGTELRHAAGAAVRQPLFGVGVGVVERGRGLEIEDEDRDFGNLNDGQDG